MLARLDESLAPAHASVNREGNLLRVVGVGEAERIDGVVGEMGYIIEPITEPPDVARWFGARDVDELSQEEAGVLAQRWTDDLVAEGILRKDQRVVEPLKVALLAALRQAARSGTTEGMRIDEDPNRRALGAQAATPVIDWIAQKLSPAHE